MKFFYDPGDPSTTGEIVSCISELEKKAHELFSKMEPVEFFAKPEKGWSAAENVGHLIKTTWPITLALKLPRVLPRILFGKNKRKPRSFKAIREVYYKSLANGFQAGMYTPLSVRLPTNAAEKQKRMIERLRSAKGNLIKTIQAIPDSDLDLVQLPHPAIGKVSMREMVLTTINHDIHHLSVLHNRRADAL